MLGHWEQGVPPAGPSQSLHLGCGGDWSISDGGYGAWLHVGLALPHTHSRLSQGAVDDVDDGLQAAALQQRAVVSLDDVHRNLPIAHLQMWTSHCDATSQCASADASASPAPLT